MRTGWARATLGCAVLACAAGAFAAPAAAEGTAAGGTGRDVSRLAWMAGTWVGHAGGKTTEEHWLAPAGGLMLGLHRDVSPGGRVFFEFLRIEDDAEGAVYIASPAGAPGTPFRLVETGATRVVFENRAHDYPQRIIYWLAADGSLTARIEGEKKGRLEMREWRWRPAAGGGGGEPAR